MSAERQPEITLEERLAQAAVFRNQGNLDAAVACYNKAIEIKSDFAEAHFGLGICYQRKGQSEEAAACYKQAIKFKQDFVEAYNNLGVYYTRKGELEEAVACYNEAIRFQPGCAEIYNNLADAYLLQNKDDFAAVYCCKALDLIRQGEKKQLRSLVEKRLNQAVLSMGYIKFFGDGDIEGYRRDIKDPKKMLDKAYKEKNSRKAIAAFLAGGERVYNEFIISKRWMDLQKEAVESKQKKGFLADIKAAAQEINEFFRLAAPAHAQDAEVKEQPMPAAAVVVARPVVTDRLAQEQHGSSYQNSTSYDLGEGAGTWSIRFAEIRIRKGAGEEAEQPLLGRRS